MTIIELRNKRAQKLAAAKAFLESNRNQDGFLSEEDDATYTKLETEITNLGNEISRMERLESLDIVAVSAWTGRCPPHPPGCSSPPGSSPTASRTSS